jgi:DHA2 family multidrug resistance protein
VIDWPGIGLLVVGLGSLQTVLERGETEDWFSKPYITVLAITAGISLLSFIIWELVAEHPVVDLRVLKSRTLATAATLTFILGFALFSTVFIVPVFAQRLLGFTALQTGLLFLPGAAVSVVVLPVIGKLIGKGFSPKIMVVMGFLTVAWFTTLLSHLDLSAGEHDFFWPIILRAIGLCLMIVPLTQLAVSGLRPRDIPQGVALNNMMRQLGGSFGIAFINTFLDHRGAAHRLNLVSQLATGDHATDARLHQVTQAMLAKGASSWEAPSPASRACSATLTPFIWLR